MANERILLVDDEPNILGSLRSALELEGFRIDVAGDGARALATLEETRFDAMLLDVVLPGKNGLDVLREVVTAHPSLPVLMMSGNATLEVAVDAVRLGAVDFLEKPIGTDKLLITLTNALRLARLEKDAAEAKRRSLRDLQMVGGSAKMLQLGELVRRAAPSTARVFITGERGTGKELVARAFHSASKRQNMPFIKLNCAAIPAELIESELFGHEKGAFTGATRERPGKFELAHGGTLFLDEIGDLAQAAQAKVLRALQEGEIERVGGSTTRKVDVRVLSATNKNLTQEIASGRFRADLYDRLNVIPVALPPLREHKEDLPALVQTFLERACRDNDCPIAELEDGALALLLQHDWPGNVRELKNLVERLCILAEPVGPGSPARIDAMAVQAALPRLEGATRPKPVRGQPLKDQLNAAEREIIVAALEANQHQMAATARELGLERSHLYKKVRLLGIRRSSAPPDGRFDDRFDDGEGEPPSDDDG